MKKRKESGTIRVLRDLDQIESDILVFGLSQVARDRGCVPKAFWMSLNAARKFREQGRIPKVGRPRKAAPAPAAVRQVAMSPVPSVMPTDWEVEEYGSLPTHTPYRHEGRDFDDEPDL